VIQRRRLLDAAERVHAGEPVAWADLAGELGYSDQAHLVRDFAAAVGTPPASYARTLGPSVVDA
jgi:AraC-like DNA-binding protein